jgi:PAS domain S-box-containing protein
MLPTNMFSFNGLSIILFLLTSLTLILLKPPFKLPHSLPHWCAAYLCLACAQALSFSRVWPVLTVVLEKIFLFGFSFLFYLGLRTFTQKKNDQKPLLIVFFFASFCLFFTHFNPSSPLLVSLSETIFPALLMCLSALSVLSMRFRFEQEYGQGKHIAYLLSGLLFAEAMLLLGSVFYSGRAAEQLIVENVLLCIQLVLAFSTMLLILHQSNHASSGLTGSQPETQNRFKEVAGSEDRVALFETVFQLVPDTVTITRLDTGQYLDVNRNWEPMSGYSREEAIGRTSTELNLWVNPEQRREFVARVAHEAEVRNIQAAFRHKDGRIFQCRISGTRFSLNGCEYLMLTSRNIDMEIATENARQIAETMLRENEKKYTTLFQLSPLPLGLIDVGSHQMIEVNDAWLTQFKFDRRHVITDVQMRDFWVTPEQPDAAIRSLLNHKEINQIEVVVRNSAGVDVICLMSARLLDMNSKTVFIFSLMDVTRQYQVEKEIREMSAELEIRVRQRTQNLEDANAELASVVESLRRAQEKLIRSEKMAALGSLVAGIAHELNTPLGNSVTVASTLQDQTTEFSQTLTNGQLKRSALNQYIEVATHGTELLMRNLSIARDLIASFKQVAVDQSSSQRRVFDLATVLNEIIATLSPMYKKGPYILKTNFAEKIEMASYPGPLGQILTNFVTNALIHAFDGRDDGEMSVNSRLLNEKQVEIVFADNGVGITEADQKRVFDPFFTTRLGQGGSGLGMHIVYNLVTDVLGGEIRLQSRPGAGTSFTLLLPLVAPHISLESDVIAIQ